MKWQLGCTVVRVHTIAATRQKWLFLLLLRGSDICLVSVRGRTCFHLAGRTKYVLNLEILFTWDANTCHCKVIICKADVLRGGQNASTFNTTHLAEHLRKRHAKERYLIPGWKYLTDTALPALYQRVSSQLAAQLNNVKAMSFTTDIWTSEVSPMSLNQSHSGCCCIV